MRAEAKQRSATANLPDPGTPRHFYKGTGTIPSRVGYALLAIVPTKGDNGEWQLNYSGLLGGLAAGAISNSYLPAGSRKTIDNAVGGAFQSFALRGVGTLEEEFLARWSRRTLEIKGRSIQVSSRTSESWSFPSGNHGGFLSFPCITVNH
jgi:hypothetical protein